MFAIENDLFKMISNHAIKSLDHLMLRIMPSPS